MTSEILAAPGSRFGPCERECHHIDCAAMRRIADAVCRLCGKSIGYNARFIRENGGFAHSACAEGTKCRHRLPGPLGQLT